MQRQNAVGPMIPVPAAGTSRASGIYLAQVVSVSPANHAVHVLLPGLSALGAAAPANGFRARVLEHRAGPYVGDVDLPREGDWGVVVFPNGSDQMAVWLGSLYQDLDTMVTANRRERLSHHDSHVWWRIAEDGTIEFTHPSGTYVRLGSGTALSARTRQERQGDTRRDVPYTVPTKPAITVHLKHSSGTLISVDPSGNVTVVGKGTKTETVDGAVTEAYQAGWSLTVTQNGTVEVTGALLIKADDLTLLSTNPSPGTHLHLGGATGEDWIVLKAAIDAIKAAFDAHTHPGVQGGSSSTAVPTVAMPAFVQDTDYSGQAKAT